eukprot:5920758-Amphidinium_carterae.1
MDTSRPSQHPELPVDLACARVLSTLRSGCVGRQVLVLPSGKFQSVSRQCPTNVMRAYNWLACI